MGITLKSLHGSPTRKVVLLAIILAMGLAAGTYAYYALVPLSETVGPSVSITSPPLQLSLSLDKAEYQTSDNLTLSFSLRNISNRTVTMTESRTYSLASVARYTTTSAVGVSTRNAGELERRSCFDFTLVGSDGTFADVPRAGIGFPEMFYVALEPDGCLNQTFSFSSLLSFWNLMISDQPPHTGTFQIRASLADFSVEGIDAATFETPSIAFTIR